MSKLDRELLDNSIADLLAFSRGEDITHPGSANQRHKLAANEGKGRNYDHETGIIKGKKRNFLETVELQIALIGYDPSKDKRFNGTMKLPNPARGALKVCMLGTEKDVERARDIGVEAMSEDDLKSSIRTRSLSRSWRPSTMPSWHQQSSSRRFRVCWDPA